MFWELPKGIEANLTVSEAVGLWPRLMATGMSLGSPATMTGTGWLDEFMTQVQQRHLRVDFICLHWYGDITRSNAVESLRRYVDKYWEKYHKPIWLTEFSGGDFDFCRRTTTVQDNARFAAAAGAMLESLPYVQRFAWYGAKWTPDDNNYRTVGLYDSFACRLTPVGAAYKALKAPPAVEVLNPLTPPPGAMGEQQPGGPLWHRFDTAPLPPVVPFTFKKNDRLIICGDSITEARRYARMLETYLTVCEPELQVEVRNAGKGGETAAQFLKRMDDECLNFKPTVATVCYGMNDSSYANDNKKAASKYRANCEEIVSRLEARGVRVVLASPGCLGKLPPWQFVRDYKGTEIGLNTTLMRIRDQATLIAAAHQLPFVDNFSNLYSARADALGKFGSDYAVCGAEDGVHPSWAGQVVMAQGFFKALGFDGNLGTFYINLANQTATTDAGHQFTGAKAGTYTFISSRYPYCAEGLPDKDWSIRSGMTLAPFNQDFNRMRLKVSGLSVDRCRVYWINEDGGIEEYHTYRAADLREGVNLAEDFHVNPFSHAFYKIDDLIFKKQTVEGHEVWHRWGSNKNSAAEGLPELETSRRALLDQIKQAFVPVTHRIRIEPLDDH